MSRLPSFRDQMEAADDACCVKCNDDCLHCPHVQKRQIARAVCLEKLVKKAKETVAALYADAEEASSQGGIIPAADGAKRGRGAPKGNLNALKHGLYIEGKFIRNTNPVERIALMDFNGIIANFKHYMDATYQKGLKAVTLADFNETMRSLSMGLLALARAAAVHNLFSSYTLPDQLALNENTKPEEVVDYYNQKVDSFSEAFNPEPVDLPQPIDPPQG